MCLPIKPYRIEREWKHAGLSCAVVQAREGMHRCGYVRVPPGHAYFGIHYDKAVGVDVHGDLTFSELEPCTEHEDGQGWWFGFDCAHCGDLMYDPAPDLASMTPQGRERWMDIDSIHRQCHGEFLEEHYWTQVEVERECERLAEQLCA